MLRKLAAFEGNKSFEDRLREYRSRLRALYHFTGGNPRLGVMLYDLVANRKIRGVHSDLDVLLDQLTPFYQDRMKDLAPQERRLLECMALLPEGCTPTELAREARLPAKTVRSLMIRLEYAGYLRRERRRQKQTVYILPERFFRIWHQMNHSRTARGRVQYLLEFFSSWYATREERDRVWDEITTEFERGLEAQDDDLLADLGESMQYVAAVSEGDERFERMFEQLRNSKASGGTEYVRHQLESLDREFGSDSEYFIHRGRFCCIDTDDYLDALESFRTAYQLDKECGPTLLREVRAIQTDSRQIWYALRRFRWELSADLDRDNQGIDAQAVVDLVAEATEPQWLPFSALQRLREPEVEDLITVLEGTSSPRKRAWIATLLGRTGCRSTIPALIQTLRNDEVDYPRGAAATALGHIGVEEAVAPLIEALRDEAGNVRGSAAAALGAIGCLEAVDPLIPLLMDEDRTVRYSCALALARLTEGKAFDGADEALRSVALCGPQNPSRMRLAVESLVESAFERETSTRFKRQPHTVAVEFLTSGRNPAVIERQHPEMREAAQLLLGLFDSANPQAAT